jgi:hypothetical protein
MRVIHLRSGLRGRRAVRDGSVVTRPDWHSLTRDRVAHADCVGLRFRSGRRCGFGVERDDQVVEGSASRVERTSGKALPPSLFQGCDRGSRFVEYGAPPLCRKDQLGAAVGAVRTSDEVAQLLQLVDELGASSEAELRFAGKVGEADAVDADVAPYLEVRKANVPEPAVGLCVGEELGPELVQQSAEDLTDSQSVARECS